MNPDEVVPLHISKESGAITPYIEGLATQNKELLWDCLAQYQQFRQVKNTIPPSPEVDIASVQCTLLCASLPDSIPDWITAELRMVEEGFYCIVNLQHSELSEILTSEFDPSDRLQEQLLELGFKDVTEIRWFYRDL